jgi:hypothetical protein
MLVYTKTDDPEVRAGSVFDEYLEGLEKKGARRKDIVQDGCRGAELSWDLDEIHALKMRCFLAPERVYEVVACGPKGSSSFQNDTTMLFSSFTMNPAVSQDNERALAWNPSSLPAGNFQFAGKNGQRTGNRPYHPGTALR